MPTPVTFNGVVYQVPVQGDLNWAPPLTRYLVALAAGAISPAGGSYPLTADLNFGSSFGLVAPYYKSSSANISTAGVLRLSNTDSIGWRNFANSGNLLLGVNTSNQLTFGGTPIQPAITLLDGEIWIGNSSNLPIGRILSGGVTVTDTGVTSISSNYITNAMVNSAAAIAYSKLNLTGSIVNTDVGSSAAIAYSKLALSNSIVNADVNTAAAIAYSKLNLSASIVNTDIAAAAAIAYTKLAALNASIVPVTNSSGFLTSSTTTTTQLSFLDATSSIQTQLNGKQATGNYITALTGDVTATGPGSVAATLATVNGNVGSFGSSTSIPSFTVNAKGLITAANGNVVIAPAGTLTGTTLASNVVTSSLTAVGTITTGTWQGTAITVANGGTGDTSLTAYAVLTGGTTSTAPIQSIASVGTSGQVLTSNGAGALPTFQTSTASGVVNAGTANQVAYYAASASTVSGTNAFIVGANGPNGVIVGTNTNDSAAAGKVGEYVESVVSAVNFPTSAAYGDLTSISLTAGDWDVTFNWYAAANGSANTGIYTGISQTSGNSTTGLVNGSNWQQASFPPTASNNAFNVIAAYRQSLSGTTTIYAKFMSTYTVATPQMYGRLSARRMR